MTASVALALALLLGGATTPEGLPVPSGWSVHTAGYGRVRIVHPQEAGHLAAPLARDAVSFDGWLRELMGGDADRALTIYLAPSRRFETELDKSFHGASDWAAGFALPRRGIIVLRGDPRAGPHESSMIPILRHELVHLVLAERLGGYRLDVPWWFNEGASMYLANEGASRGLATLAWTALSQRMIPLEELVHQWPADVGEARTAYIESYSFVAHLVEEHGWEVLPSIVNGVGGGRPFFRVFEEATGRTAEEEEARWRRSFLWRYRWIPVLTSGTTLWAGVMLLVFYAGYRRRRRSRETLERWDEEERRYLDPDGRVM